jgi:hypothetical protein
MATWAIKPPPRGRGSIAATRRIARIKVTPDANQVNVMLAGIST